MVAVSSTVSSSSPAATVTVCAVFQVAVVKVSAARRQRQVVVGRGKPNTAR